MNSQSLARVGLSLIGVYTVAEALRSFPLLLTFGALLMQLPQGRALVPLVTIVPFAALLLFGCVLVTQPGTMARWLPLAGESNDAVEVSANLATLLFAIAGIFIVAGAVPDLLQSVLNGAMTNGDGLWLRPLVGQIVRVLFGLLLFFRPAVVLQFWEKRAGAGEGPAAPSPAA